MRTLTLENRRVIEKMWADNLKPVQIAAELEISQCTVYTELKRRQKTDEAGGVVLDENFRPAYSAERGEALVPEELAEPWTSPEKASQRKERVSISNFEKVTASPTSLGQFLAALSVAGGPWEEAFHRTFCDGCGEENCDAENCPHEKERENPLWWLMREADQEADAIIKALNKMLTIEIHVAVQRFNRISRCWDIHGNVYVLEATPKEIVAEPLTMFGGTGAEARFAVSRFSAADGSNERWTIEWQGQKAEAGKEAQE